MLKNIRLHIEQDEEKQHASLIISKLNKERYQRGIISYVDYLYSQIDKVKINKSFVAQELAFAEKTIALYKSLGGGWQNLKESRVEKSSKYNFKSFKEDFLPKRLLRQNNT